MIKTMKKVQLSSEVRFRGHQGPRNLRPQDPKTLTVLHEVHEVRDVQIKICIKLHHAPQLGSRGPGS